MSDTPEEPLLPAVDLGFPNRVGKLAFLGVLTAIAQAVAHRLELIGVTWVLVGAGAFEGMLLAGWGGHRWWRFRGIVSRVREARPDFTPEVRKRLRSRYCNPNDLFFCGVWLIIILAMTAIRALALLGIMPLRFVTE